MIDESEFIKNLMKECKEYDVSDFVRGIKDRYQYSDLVREFAQKIGVKFSPSKSFETLLIK